MREKFLRAFLIAALMLCGAILLWQRSPTLVAQARSDAKAGGEGARGRWEHCAVISRGVTLKNGDKTIGYATVCYFRGGGRLCETSEVEHKRGDSGGSWNEDSLNATVSLVANLGEEGWEMVGEGNAEPFKDYNPTQVLYFKRAKL